MNDPKALAEIRDLLSHISGLNVNNLIKRPEWGVINFEGIKQEIENAILLALQLNTLPIERIPQGNFNGLIQVTRNLRTRISAIETFDISKTANPANDRNNISNQFRSDCDQFTTQCATWLPFLSTLFGDAKKQAEAINALIARSNALFDETTSKVKEKNDEINKIIAAAREAAGKAGVQIYAADFKDAANENNLFAAKWLLATATIGILSILALAGFLTAMLIYKPSGELFIQLIITKIVTVSVLLGATVWCGRMYKAYKHQESMNTFRSNALRTFQSFISAASDQQSKDAVLLETTRAIFAITPTGYLDGHSENKDPSMTIMEVVRQGLEAGKK